MIALSRTCDLTDFPGCVTVAAWQQALAKHAWNQWVEASHIRTREPSLCVNWSGCAFLAPGPSAIYQYPGQADNGVQAGRLPAVWGLSVLDRIDAPVRFLTRSCEVLRRGGLLFLSFAFWDAEGPDTASGAEVRKRIYDVTSTKKLIAEARRIGLVSFGGHDWGYHGDKLDDHTLASLVLTRR
jgi:hypothetical protein